LIRRPQKGGVLDVVRADAVAVLEVDPQVLDRLARQLGPDPGHLGVVEAGQRAVLVQGTQGRLSPLPCGVGREPVGRDVGGVHRLPVPRRPRIPAGPLGVVAGQQRLGEASQLGGHTGRAGGQVAEGGGQVAEGGGQVAGH